MSKKNLNFDTFNVRYNKDIYKLLGLYQDILNIMEYVKSNSLNK